MFKLLSYYLNNDATMLPIISICSWCHPKMGGVDEFRHSFYQEA